MVSQQMHSYRHAELTTQNYVQLAKQSVKGQDSRKATDINTHLFENKKLYVVFLTLDVDCWRAALSNDTVISNKLWNGTQNKVTAYVNIILV